jgi:LmbE family N-acetylglucosaminyl deacetylase
MRILYVFPHPDDESFGPALAISRQRRSGQEVCLLTLTRGGATKQRHKFGYSVEEMGEVRFREMECVARVLDLTDMTVLDLPDGGLKDMDPRQIEDVVRSHIEKIHPEIVVTYPVHGISGFPDHLVTHAVVKRVFLQMREEGADYLKRLAFFTVDDAFTGSPQGPHRLHHSSRKDIDCVMEPHGEDIEVFQKALSCYETYQDTIAATGIRKAAWQGVSFEIFGEFHDPPLGDLGDLSGYDKMAIPGNDAGV